MSEERIKGRKDGEAQRTLDSEMETLFYSVWVNSQNLNLREDDHFIFWRFFPIQSD